MKKRLLVFLEVLLIVGFFTENSLAAIYTKMNTETYNLKFTMLNQIPDPVEPGDYVEIRWKVENMGSENAENVYVELIEEYPFSLDRGVEKVQKIGSVWGRQIGNRGVILYWKIRIDENAVEGVNKIKLRYSLDNGMTWIYPEGFDVRIQTKDAFISVDSITVDGSWLKPGKKTQVIINVTNLADSLLKNIRFSLDLKGIPIVTIDSTDEKYLKNLDAKESSSIVFWLLADANAEPGSHKIPLNIFYSDQTGQEHEVSNTFGIIINSDPEYSLVLDSSQTHQARKKGDIVIKVVNKGLTEMKLVTAKLLESDDYKVLSNSEVYLGNIDSDDYETATYTIYPTPKKKGDINLIVRLEYKDAWNTDYSKDFLVSLKMYSSSEAKKYLNSGGNSVIGVVIVLIIVIAGIWYYRRYRKKKK